MSRYFIVWKPEERVYWAGTAYVAAPEQARCFGKRSTAEEVAYMQDGKVRTWHVGGDQTYYVEED